MEPTCEDLLEFDYIGQCQNRLKTLREQLELEKPNEKENRHASIHRLFRCNVFDYIEPKRKQYLEKVLIRILTSLGEQINRNLIAIKREKRAPTMTTPTPITVSSRANSIRSSCATPTRNGPRTRSMSKDSNPEKQIELIIISSDEEEIDEDVVQENGDIDHPIEIKTEKFDSRFPAGRSVELQDLTNGNGSHQPFSVPSSVNDMPPTASSQRQPPNSLLMVNRKNNINFFYDKCGVINMRPKKSVKFSPAGASKQAVLLHLVAETLKLIESGAYMSKRELYYKSLRFCRVKESNIRNQSQIKPSNEAQLGTQSGTQSATQSGTQSVAQPATQIAVGTQQQASQFATQSSSRLGTQRSSQSQTNNAQNGSQRSARYNPDKLFHALDDLCCLVGCSKVHLHIISRPKGLVYGDLKFKLESGETYDCLTSRDGTTIPDSLSPIVELSSNANFILVLEKDSVMQKMLYQEEQSKFTERYGAILFTAKGYPDVTSRAFVNFLWTKLKIPILVLTDADPHGIEIACSYKFGVYSTAFESNYTAVPQIRWLGLLPSDIVKLSIPNAKTLPQTPNDKRKLKSLLSRPYLRSRERWLSEMNLLKELDRKAEIESLDSDGQYLVNTYLPNKLRFGSWV